MPQGSAVDTSATEREYVAHRSMVMAMLATEFGFLRDHDELYQEAWTEVLELQARGHDVSNLGGLLRTIVWRRARDRARGLPPAPVDPSDELFSYEMDTDALPDEQAQVRLDAARIREVVDSLNPRQAAVIKLRFDCDMASDEIERLLGISRKRLNKIVRKAYRLVGQALSEQEESALSDWRRHQRSLLLACETGVASADQRSHAHRMIREDPICRAMLREIRSTLEGVAAIIPLPVLVTQAANGRIAQLRLSIVDRVGMLRDGVADWAGRMSGHSSAIEQTSASGAASVTGAFAVKAALVCVAVTGTTVVCLDGGVFSGASDPRPPARHAKAAPTPRVEEPIPPRIVPVAPAEAPSRPRAASRPTPQPAAPPPPSPAPDSSTEFGPGTVGSSSASSTPAAAPAGSNEFGP